MYKKILLATDGSEFSLIAAKKIVKIHKAFNSKIVIFHAEKHYTPVEYKDRYEPFFDFTKLTHNPEEDQIAIEEAFKSWGKTQLEKTKNIFEEEGIEVEARMEFLLGPVEYAKKVVNEENFDLVVAGCKGHHSLFRKVFFGSVAEKIVNEVECDVLIIRKEI